MGIADDLIAFGQQSEQAVGDASGGSVPSNTGAGSDLLSFGQQAAAQPASLTAPPNADLDPQTGQNESWLGGFAQRHPGLIKSLGLAARTLPAIGPTFGEGKSHVASAAISGVAGTIGSGLRAISEITSEHPGGNLVSIPFARASKEVEWIRKATEPDTLAGKVAEQVGGMAPYFASGGVPLMALNMYDTVYQAAKEGGADDGTARLVAFPGMIATGALEIAKLRNIAKATAALSGIESPGLRDAMTWAVKTITPALKNGSLGVAQQAIENAISNYYDPEHDVFDFEAATVGFAQRFGMEAAGGALLPQFGALMHKLNVAKLEKAIKEATPEDQALAKAIMEKGGAVPAENAPASPTVAPGSTQGEGVATQVATPPEKATSVTDKPAKVAGIVEPLKQGEDPLPSIYDSSAAPAGTDEIGQVGRGASDFVRSLADGWVEVKGSLLGRWMRDEMNRVKSTGTLAGNWLAEHMRAWNDTKKEFRLRMQEHTIPWLEQVKGKTGVVPFTERWRKGREQHRLYKESADLVQHTAPVTDANGVTTHQPRQYWSSKFVAAMESDEMLAQTMRESQSPKVWEAFVKGGRKISRAAADLAVEVGVKVPKMRVDKTWKERYTKEEAKIRKQVEEGLGKQPKSKKGAELWKERADFEVYKHMRGWKEKNPAMKLVLEDFKGEKQGRRVPRAFTKEFWEILQAGSAHPLWRPMMEMLAEMNGITHEVTMRKLEAIRNTQVERKSPFEVTREFPKMATHIADGAGGKLELYGSDPFGFVAAIHGAQTDRLAFIKHFGQDGEMAKLYLNALRVGAGNMGLEAGERAFKIMNGLPTDISTSPFRSRGARNLVRSWNFITNVFKTSALSMAWAYNVPESLVTVLPQVGMKNYFKALRNVMHDSTLRGPALEGLSRNAVRLMDVENFNWNSNQWLESIARRYSNVMLTPFNWANGASGAIHAQAAMELMADLGAGRAGLRERMLLERLSFRPEQIKNYMEGTATAEQLRTVGHRMLSRGVSATLTTAEQSPLSKNKYYRDLVFFDRYAQQIGGYAADLIHQTSQALDDSLGFEWKNANYTGMDHTYAGEPRFANTGGGTEGARLRQASKSLALFFGGTALAGTMGAILKGFSTHGFFGVREKVEDIHRDAFHFVMDQYLNVLTAGMMQNVREVMTGESDLSETIGDMPGGLRVANEIWTVFRGTGAYENYEGIDKWGRFLDRNVAALPAVRSWAAVMGLGSRDQELEVAMRRYYTWLKRNTPFEHTTKSLPLAPGEEAAKWIENNKHFRAGMKQVEMAIRHGESPDKIIKRMAQVVIEGKGYADNKKIAASLTGRTLMSKVPKELMPVFLKEFPVQSLVKLMMYDNMLKTWAKTVNPTSGVQ